MSAGQTPDDNVRYVLDRVHEMGCVELYTQGTEGRLGLLAEISACKDVVNEARSIAMADYDITHKGLHRALANLDRWRARP